MTAGFKSRGLGEERWEETRGHSSSYGFTLVVDGRKGSSPIAQRLDKTERPPVRSGVDNAAGKQQGLNAHFLHVIQLKWHELRCNLLWF